MRCPIVGLPAKFEYIQERENSFLALFPHRYDYIWAEHAAPQHTPDWKTESRHPLSDRLVQQNSYLYGVRFGAETNYCLLDIDAGSAYHPSRDPFAIAQIVAALEPIGLVRYIACRSSYSGGLHLYFPFPQAQSSWKLAIGLSSLLENAGFKVFPGQLEVFPNPKPYSVEGKPSLFNAHRLPLQIGSYLLDAAFQPVWSDSQQFVQQWQLAQGQNDLDTATLKQILKQARRRQFRISGKADKFINDLNAEIEAGWTGAGQTNRLLGRITMRAYIFHHILSGGEPLQGKALVDEIIETAQSLPGYRDWCGHQHEIEQRAEEWARCIENSHYFHYGQANGKFKAPIEPELQQAIETTPSWNQQQLESARDRIRYAIADLLEQEKLPAKATARFQALLKYGIGGGSLYRHRDLWHPNSLSNNLSNNLSDRLSNSAVENVPVENFLLDSIPQKTESQLDSLKDESNWLYPPSLFPGADGNVASSQDSQLRSLPNPANSGSNFVASVSEESLLTPQGGVRAIQQTLAHLKAQRKSSQAAVLLAHQQHDRIQQASSHAKQRNRMQEFLASDDPILVAEALAWLQNAERRSPNLTG